MADAVHTAAVEFDKLIPELWSPVFYPTLVASVPFPELVARDYEGVIKNLGDTVNVQSMPEFSQADELSENAAADAEAVTVTQTQLVVNKMLVKDFIVTSKAMWQSLDAQTGLRDMAIYSVAKKLQALLFDASIPSSAAPDHQISYASGTTLALADIISGKKLLDGANVPDNGQRCMLTDTDQANDLLNITGFTSRDYVPNADALTQGAITTPVLGFKVRSTTVAADRTYLFHPAYMQMAIQKEPMVEEFNLGADGKRGKRVNVTMMVGIKQFSNVRVVKIS